jgi:membrane protease YdiL (CAAX protease family)
MTNILQDENARIRSGWRIVVFLFVFLLFAVVFRVAEEILIGSFEVDAKTAESLYFAINFAGLLFLSLFLGAAAGKLFENLPFRALGASLVNGWFRHLLLGLAIGAGTLCVAVLIAFVLGGERFEFNLSNGTAAMFASLTISLVVFAIGAAWEEAFFRGYIFQTLTRSNLTWLALVLTSAFFGIVHLSNENATAISTLNTTLAGVWFGLAYLKTRDLWLVWGMHLAWNWTQGSIFGIEVSGLTDLTPNPLLKEIDSGPTWLTGTTYGLEGGVACTVALVLSMIVIWWLKAEPPA